MLPWEMDPVRPWNISFVCLMIGCLHKKHVKCIYLKATLNIYKMAQTSVAYTPGAVPSSGIGWKPPPVTASCPKSSLAAVAVQYLSLSFLFSNIFKPGMICHPHPHHYWSPLGRNLQLQKHRCLLLLSALCSLPVQFWCFLPHPQHLKWGILVH